MNIKMGYAIKKEMANFSKKKKKEMAKVQVQTYLQFKTTAPLNIFLIDINFNKSTIELQLKNIK